MGAALRRDTPAASLAYKQIAPSQAALLRLARRARLQRQRSSADAGALRGATPDWARRFRAQQTHRAHAQAASKAVREGSAHPTEALPDLGQKAEHAVSAFGRWRGTRRRSALSVSPRATRSQSPLMVPCEGQCLRGQGAGE